MSLLATLLARFVVTNTAVPANVDRRDLVAELTAVSFLVDDVALINGTVALSVPTGAQALVIEFLTGAQTVTLKGAGGDTGIRLSTLAIPAAPVMLPIVGGTTVIVLTSTGVGTAKAYWF